MIDVGLSYCLSTILAGYDNGSRSKQAASLEPKIAHQQGEVKMMPVHDPAPDEAFDFVAASNSSASSPYQITLKPLGKEQQRRWQIPLDAHSNYDFNSICPYCLTRVAKGNGTPKGSFTCHHGNRVHERCRQEKIATDESGAPPPCPLCPSEGSERAEEIGKDSSVITSKIIVTMPFDMLSKLLTICLFCCPALIREICHAITEVSCPLDIQRRAHFLVAAFASREEDACIKVGHTTSKGIAAPVEISQSDHYRLTTCGQILFLQVFQELKACRNIMYSINRVDDNTVLVSTGLSALVSLCQEEPGGRDRDGFNAACTFVLRHLRREQQARSPGPPEVAMTLSAEQIVMYSWCWKACGALAWVDKSLCLSMLNRGLAELLVSHLQACQGSITQSQEGLQVLASVLRHAETVSVLGSSLHDLAKIVRTHLEEAYPQPAILVSLGVVLDTDSDSLEHIVLICLLAHYIQVYTLICASGLSSQRYTYEMLLPAPESPRPFEHILRHIRQNWVMIDVVREGFRCIRRMLGKDRVTASLKAL